MELGVALPQRGRLADPIAVRTAAEAADELGYASVWASDQLDGALDPVATLTLAAASTSRVRLGTSVLVAPRYGSDVLRRTVRTLAEVCDGRLTVGLGVGPDVTEDGDVATALAAAVDVLGDLPRRPPILLDCTSPAALDIVARSADGWNPTVTDGAALARRWSSVVAAASAYGRQAGALRLVARVEVRLEDGVDAAAGDLVRIGAAGADEVILALAGDPTLDEALGTYARLAEALEPVAVAVVDAAS